MENPVFQNFFKLSTIEPRSRKFHASHHATHYKTLLFAGSVQKVLNVLCHRLGANFQKLVRHINENGTVGKCFSNMGRHFALPYQRANNYGTTVEGEKNCLESNSFYRVLKFSAVFSLVEEKRGKIQNLVKMAHKALWGKKCRKVLRIAIDSTSHFCFLILQRV